MTKKLFITILVLASTLLFSSSVFATNTIENTTRNMGNEMQSSWDKLSNSAQNMGNNVKGAMNNVGDTLTGNTDNNNDNSRNTNNNNDNGYTATRTTGATTNTGLFGMTTDTMWTWIILAILGVSIVALIWSYGSQTRTNKNTK